MRDTIIAGNWKMNTTVEEGKMLVKEVINGVLPEDLNGKKVVFGVPFISLTSIKDMVKDKTGFYVAAQNISSFGNGAYTGETSGEMLSSSHIDMAIIGHSERREYFAETNSVLAQKVKQALHYGITPIYCCGEVLEDRKNGKFKEIILQQIEEGLFGLSESEFSKVIIAYEPVWAIGTGETASPEQAEEVHSFIRSEIARKYSDEIAQNCPILYGGSMKPSNAKELVSMPNIDGGLIGGASLKAEDFIQIIKSA
jgi:triosephosphate isomerase